MKLTLITHKKEKILQTTQRSTILKHNSVESFQEDSSFLSQGQADNYTIAKQIGMFRLRYDNALSFTYDLFYL